MAQIELAPEVLDDFERLLDHLLRAGSPDATGRIAAILNAIDVLTHSPLLGRRVPGGGGTRELILGERARGYVALYRFVPTVETVFVLAIRSQREDGEQREGG